MMHLFHAFLFRLKGLQREVRGFVWLDQFMQDLRGAARMLRKNPGFTAITVAIIALGVGATTAIFSIVNGIVLRPLPYPDSGNIVSIRETFLPAAPDVPVSAGTYFEWKRQSTAFADMGAALYWPCNLTVDGDASRRFGLKISNDFFSSFGLRPMLGRDFRPEEHQPGRDNVVILNHKLWASRFNSDPRIIGRTLRINEQAYTVVGVMPSAFLPETMTDPGLFSPAVFTAQDRSNYRRHDLSFVFAHLSHGVTIEQASSQLSVISERLQRQYPDIGKGWGVKITPLIETKIGNVRPLLLLLLGAVALLLMIASVNVANLLVARASSREKELAVRTALGASRGRVIRQLLVESLALSFIGGALGTMLAYASMNVLLGMGPIALPRSKEVAIDGDALFFALGLALLTGVGFGIFPALRASRVNLADAMKAGARGSGEASGGHRLRNLLVVTEVSLALVLLTAAGLLMNSFVRLQRVPLGFNIGTTQIGKIYMLHSRYPTPEKVTSFVNTAVERLAAVQGVNWVAFSTNAPAWGRSLCAVQVAGRDDLDPWKQPPVSYYAATPDFFKVLGLPLKEGRLFDRHDDASGPPVVVVSDDFAWKYFPTGDAIGKRIKIINGPTPTWREIIGIVPNIKESGPAIATPFQVYEPFAQEPISMLDILIRTNGPVPGISRSLRAAMDTIDPDMPIPEVGSDLNYFLRDTISSQRFALFLFAVFSASALVLSAMGIYGVVSYSVAQRTTEVGVRMALGARPRDILALMFLRTGRIVGIGLAIGLAGSLACTRLLNSLLFEINSHDPVTLVIVVAALGGVAMLACWIPARRAAMLDPMVALRTD